MKRHDEAIESSERSEEQLVARLIAAAGPPPPAPEIEIARIQEAVRSEWRRRYAWRRRERLVFGWQVAAAAAVLLAALAFVFSPQRAQRAAASAAAVLAEVDRVAGEAWVVDRDGAPARALTAGERLVAGARLSTVAVEGVAGRVALRWGDGRSLRLDTGSEIALAEANRVELHRGALYVDAYGAEAGSPPTIVTARGRFDEVGTQYEVRLLEVDGPGVRLRVREGAVTWRENGRTATAEAGVELALGADGSLVRDRIAPFGPDWDWVLAAAPPPALDGWPLARFLDWYGRESGLVVAYADAESESLASSVLVHGSVAQLAPPDALAAVLASSGFGARADDGALIVESLGEPRS